MLEIPDFSNTEKAYQYLDNKALHRAEWLFTMINQPLLSKIGPSILQFAFNIRLPISFLVRKTLFAQFCGGESLEECQSVTKLLERYGIGTVLDFASEGEQDEKSMRANCKEFLHTLEVIKSYGQRFAVFKPTAIMSSAVLVKRTSGQALSHAETKEMLAGEARGRKIITRAAELGLSVLIDAEESWLQGAVDDWVLQLSREFNKERPVLYQTVQLYRKDKLAYLKELVHLAEKEGFFLGLKLVRGAYLDKERARAVQMSYPSPIHDSKEACDQDYNAAIEYCIDNLEQVSIFVGTHNEESTHFLVDILLRKQTSFKHHSQKVVFSQLFGMSDHLTFNLASAGFQVLKYVPYGPVQAAIPYLIRRAQENMAIQGQMSRELSMIQKEIKRRKHR